MAIAIGSLRQGFDGYISKPVNVVEFVGTVKRYCGAPDPRGS